MKISSDSHISRGGLGLAENKATQPSLAGAWAELGKMVANVIKANVRK